MIMHSLGGMVTGSVQQACQASLLLGLDGVECGDQPCPVVLGKSLLRPLTFSAHIQCAHSVRLTVYS